MEYNYTREFKQPVKFYSLKGYAIPFAPNGIRLEYLVVCGVLIALVLVFALIAYVTKISFIQSLFTNYWMLVIAGVGVVAWTLFSLKWDNKNFIDYLLGRGNYLRHKKKRYEHEMLVPFFHEKVTYQVKKKRR